MRRGTSQTCIDLPDVARLTHSLPPFFFGASARADKLSHPGFNNPGTSPPLPDSLFNNLSPPRAPSTQVTLARRIRPVAESHPIVTTAEIVNRTSSKDEW